LHENVQKRKGGTSAYSTLYPGKREAKKKTSSGWKEFDKVIEIAEIFPIRADRETTERGKRNLVL